MGLQGSSIQSPFLGGLVAVPSLAQSQLILEVAAITAEGEALMHKASFTVEVSLPLLFRPRSATRSCFVFFQSSIRSFVLQERNNDRYYLFSNKGLEKSWNGEQTTSVWGGKCDLSAIGTHMTQAVSEHYKEHSRTQAVPRPLCSSAQELGCLMSALQAAFTLLHCWKLLLS